MTNLNMKLRTGQVYCGSMRCNIVRNCHFIIVAFYEHRIQLGSKDIFHLEAFVAKFMSIYKRWIISMFA